MFVFVLLLCTYCADMYEYIIMHRSSWHTYRSLSSNLFSRISRSSNSRLANAYAYTCHKTRCLLAPCHDWMQAYEYSMHTRFPTFSMNKAYSRSTGRYLIASANGHAMPRPHSRMTFRYLPVVRILSAVPRKNHGTNGLLNTVTSFPAPAFSLIVYRWSSWNKTREKEK